MTLLNDLLPVIKYFKVGERGYELVIRCLDLVNPPVFGTEGAPGNQGIYRMFIPFEAGLHAAIIETSHPPLNPQIYCNSLGLR